MTNRINAYERKRGISSDEVDILGAVTPAAEASAPGGIEIDTTPVYSTDKLEHEKFMQDELQVFFHEASGENEPAFVEVNVNGDYRMAVRGNTTKLRRYHVGVLAQAKQSRVRQRKVVNADGSMGFVEENVLSLTYPFTVTHEPRGKKGSDWLEEMIKTPA